MMRFAESSADAVPIHVVTRADGETGGGAISGGPFAGSITAALFLNRFVEPETPWVHFDLYGWHPATKPGQPEGGEAPTARLLFDLLTQRAGGA